jgi:uncharacterized protein YjiS (DUF1127 family)
LDRHVNANCGRYLTAWRERVWSRFALQRLSERDLVDMRLTRLDVFEEAQKPFWQE